MSFWYGLDFEAVGNMPISAVHEYLARLPVRQAELKLLLADVATIPHMKKGDRSAKLEHWAKIVEVYGAEQTAPPASPARLKLFGIGVRSHGKG